MNVTELNRNQLIELKQRRMMELRDTSGCLCYWADLADADEVVSDADVFLRYDAVEFSSDDFMCSAGR